MKLARFVLAGQLAIAAQQALAGQPVYPSSGYHPPLVTTPCPPPVLTAPMPPVSSPAATMPSSPSTTPGTSPVTPGPTPPGAATPGSATPGTAPGSAAAGAAAAAAAAGTGAAESRGESGSDALASAAPNMQGDAFSAGRLRLSFTGPGRLNGFAQAVFTPVLINGTQASGTPATVLYAQTNKKSYSLLTNSQLVDLQTRIGAPPLGFTVLQQTVPSGGGPFVVTNPVALARLQLVNGVLNTPDVQKEFLNPIFTAAERQADPSVTRVVDAGLRIGGANPLLVKGNAILPSTLEYEAVLTSVVERTIEIANPGGGGVVGRTKVSDDNNPLPRDRVIFNYDFFGGVPLSPGGTDVNRFSPGFEKTFLDGYTSVELRLPFASTLNSTTVTDGISGYQTQLGNLNITLKGLAYRSDVINVAGGVGISVPTAEDIRVRLADGPDLVRIRNQAVILSPYVAALITPTDELFAQVWYTVGFDPNGNELAVNSTGQGLQSVGRLYSAPLSQLDGQLGYWIYRACSADSLIQGVAPFIEAHYNTTLGSGSSPSGHGLTVAGSSFSELNLTAGFSTWLRNNFLISAGAVVPMLESPNRTFDYQIGLRGSWFFGQTARNLNAASRVSSF